MTPPSSLAYLKVYIKERHTGGKVKVQIPGYFETSIFTVRAADLTECPPEEPPVAPVAG